MKVGIVFHRDPTGAPSGIDLVRLRAMTRGLLARGVAAEVVAPVKEPSVIDGDIPVAPLEALGMSGRYTVVKTCYHQSIKLVQDYAGPVVSRIVRVVDEELPHRDEALRRELLACQALIHERAHGIIFNNTLNVERWRRFYGGPRDAEIIPTGCPSSIPRNAANPFRGGKPAALFLGSLAAPRMAHVLNYLAQELKDECEVHVIGANKTALYGAEKELPLHESIVRHGELPEPDIWKYIEHASVGLALATGPHAFDNDLSKMFHYLRGGLPVLSEDTVYTNYLLQETSYGEIAPFDNLDALRQGLRKLLRNPPPGPKEAVMEYMARRHSWEERVERLLSLLRRVVVS
ncbi:MAG: hypothetical protein ACP5M0_00995 [Desulfomonilaceae bacterium]